MGRWGARIFVSEKSFLAIGRLTFPVVHKLGYNAVIDVIRGGGIMATVTTPMTTEEMLALPENGMERWLIAGELRERPMTIRNRFHSRAMICVGTELELWLRRQPLPRGQVLGGEAGVRLSRDPETTVGIDVVYVSAEVVVQQTGDSTLIDGVPTLVVEILSP